MIYDIFAAGRVRRWHKNPGMSWTEDYNDAHQGRVARILLALHPKPTLQLIAAALIHDDGEIASGDLDAETKDKNPQLREMLRVIENAKICELWGIISPLQNFLSDEDKEWLKFADRLDSYIWVNHKRPQLLTRPEWVKSLRELQKFVKEKEIKGVFVNDD